MEKKNVKRKRWEEGREGRREGKKEGKKIALQHGKELNLYKTLWAFTTF